MKKIWPIFAGAALSLAAFIGTCERDEVAFSQVPPTCEASGRHCDVPPVIVLTPSPRETVTVVPTEPPATATPRIVEPPPTASPVVVPTCDAVHGRRC